METSPFKYPLQTPLTTADGNNFGYGVQPGGAKLYGNVVGRVQYDPAYGLPAASQLQYIMRVTLPGGVQNDFWFQEVALISEADITAQAAGA